MLKRSPEACKANLGAKLFFQSSPKDMFIDSREKKGEGERNIDVRETLIGCLSYVPRPGIKLKTPVCVLTGNRTHKTLVNGNGAPTN